MEFSYSPWQAWEIPAILLLATALAGFGGIAVTKGWKLPYKLAPVLLAIGCLIVALILGFTKPLESRASFVDNFEKTYGLTLTEQSREALFSGPFEVQPSLGRAIPVELDIKKERYKGVIFLEREGNDFSVLAQQTNSEAEEGAILIPLEEAIDLARYGSSDAETAGVWLVLYS